MKELGSAMLNDVPAVCGAGRGDRHDPRRGRAAAEARRCYGRPMELRAGVAATEDDVPTTTTREQPSMRTSELGDAG